MDCAGDEVNAVLKKLLPALRQLTGLTHLALGLSCFHPTSWRQLPELAGLSSQLQSLHLLNNPDMPVRIQTYTGHTDPYMRRGAAGCVTASATCAS